MTLNFIAGHLQVSALSGFNKRLLELCKAKGGSQLELAKRIGTSGPIIGRYERGEMMPSIKVAMKLAQVCLRFGHALLSPRCLPSASGIAIDHSLSPSYRRYGAPCPIASS